jgi:aspartyl protease family protein
MFQVFYMAVVMVAVGAAVVWSLDFGKELTQAAGEIARQSASAPATYGAPDSPSAPTPAAEQFAGYGEELVIRAGPSGHFIAEADVNGYEVRFLVDTGASIVMLTPDDADLLGFNLYDDDYSQVFQTPNGVLRGAPVILDDVQIGPIALSDVHATVAEAPSAISLLGMSFLRRLDGYEVRDGELVLRW